MLVESTKKREQLENMVRGKLEAEVKKLHDQVKLLNGKIIFHVTLLQREEFFFFCSHAQWHVNGVSHGSCTDALHCYIVQPS